MRSSFARSMTCEPRRTPAFGPGFFSSKRVAVNRGFPDLPPRKVGFSLFPSSQNTTSVPS
jgi:hypothetical protein